MLDIKKIGIQRQSVLDENSLDFLDIQTEMALKMQKQLAEKEDNIIREALVYNGFNPDDKDFLKDNFEMLRVDRDDFVHYYFHYGKPDEKRIISIEHKANIDFQNNFGNKLEMILSLKYY